MDTTRRPSPKADNGNANGCQLTIRLLDMLQKTKYELVQENGQRRLTAPEVIRGEKERVKGAEIFLGRLPRDCYEDELMPILERVGRLIELRLMLDFSGSTRGYAFALFEDSKTARRACTMLDGCEIRKGHRIGVVKSVDNCRLFFGGVPKNKSKEEFMEELTKILDGITEIYLYPNAQDKTLNRGFIFVEFRDHRAAAMARRKLIPGRVMLWDHEIAVDWADPEPGDPIDEDVMETVAALFVRNLSLDLQQQKIRDIFQKSTNVPILKLKKINHFAFIHYENREAAEIVMNIMSKPNSVAAFEGWEVRWAKPIGATKILERQRCINEAVAKANIRKADETRIKHNSLKQTSPKAIVQSNENVTYNETARHACDALQNFIEEHLNATCSFNFIRLPGAKSFACQINILKGTEVLLEYRGDLMPTKHKAITAACTTMHQFIAATFRSAVQAKQYSFAQERGFIEPMIGLPVRWDNEIEHH